MNEHLFELDDVARTFGAGDRAVVAVHSATLVAPPGARIAIVGPSGSGKSTLLHLVAGLDEPTRGGIRWPGLHARPQDDPSAVGVVFQGPSLVPALTARENVALPLVLRGMAHDKAQEEAISHLTRLGLEPMANQFPDELSGGQAQRVAVARVLAMRPRLILADEPTGQLDQRAAKQVVEVLLEAADHLDAGLVIATHDQHVADRMDTIWRMRDGGLEVLGREDARATS